MGLTILKILLDCSAAMLAWARILDATLIMKAMRAKRFTIILAAFLDPITMSELSYVN
jgi:hypothetical protein